MGVAIALPLAGIVVLLAPGLLGRSGLMSGGLVLSLLLLGEGGYSPLGQFGAVATVLLVVGDFATSGARSPLVAGLIGVGYGLLVVWFDWIALWLSRSPDRLSHSPR
jgi:hypothetical protein